MLGDAIRQNLHSGARVYGTHVTQTTNAVAASMLSTAGLDFVFLCAEHMPLDRAEMSGLSCLYASKGIAPVVRIPNPSAVEAAMALDGGAQGICAPYVETVEQVREVVGAVRFRPAKGKRLDDYVQQRRKVPQKMLDFFNRFNRHSFVIIGIESIPAYERLEELITVEGVDGVFIGPHDMTVSMEIPEEWDHPDFQRVVEDIVRRCRRAGVGVGIHAPPFFALERLRGLVGLGMNWILDGSDVGLAATRLKERRIAFGLATGTTPVPGAAVNPESCLTSTGDGNGTENRSIASVAVGARRRQTTP